MQDYTIGEYFTLPSKGLIYDPPINPQIKLRSMTTEEEMKRQNINKTNQYKAMCEIIDDCIVEGPDISTYDMYVGDYQFLLHKLRIVTYGPDYPVSSICPICGTANTATINLDDLQVQEYTQEFETYKTCVLPKSNKTVELRIQTPRALDNVAQRLAEFKRKAANPEETNPLLLYTLEELIYKVDGAIVNPLQLESWLRTLPMADTNMILNYAEKLGTSIGLDTNLVNICDTCGYEYPSSFRQTAEFFRPTVL